MLVWYVDLHMMYSLIYVLELKDIAKTLNTPSNHMVLKKKVCSSWLVWLQGLIKKLKISKINKNQTMHFQK
jgi:hypothetical protein